MTFQEQFENGNFLNKGTFPILKTSPIEWIGSDQDYEKALNQGYFFVSQSDAGKGNEVVKNKISMKENVRDLRSTIHNRFMNGSLHFTAE